VYPPLAKEQGVKGFVKLRVLVQRSGKIAIVRVADVEPTGYGFEKACVDAAEQWKFTPAMSGGRPVEGVAEFTIQFP
jgi:protein TonB